MTSSVGIRVPKAGSSCARCKYQDPQNPQQCISPDYIRARYKGKASGERRFIDGRTGCVITDPRQFCCNFFDWNYNGCPR